jgi:hypothetical protein
MSCIDVVTIKGQKFCVTVPIRVDWLWKILPEDPLGRFVLVENIASSGPDPWPWLTGAISKEVVNDLSAFATMAEVANVISDKDIKDKMLSAIKELSARLNIPEGFNLKIEPKVNLGKK